MVTRLVIGWTPPFARVLASGYGVVRERREGYYESGLYLSVLRSSLRRAPRASFLGRFPQNGRFPLGWRLDGVILELVKRKIRA